MLKPEDLRPRNVPVGTFVDVQVNNEFIALTALPIEWKSCECCVFIATPTCAKVRCHTVGWVTRETYTEYLQHKLLK